MQLEVTTEKILAENVAFETFLTDFMGQHVEWVDGKVVEVYTMAISKTHDDLTRYLSIFFSLYLDRTHEGKLQQDPFVMRLETTARQPDLMVILNENLEHLHETYLAGAADLAIEVVSPESAERDRGRKFFEYEAAGVKEYWIIDPWRKEALFYVLGENHLYERHDPNTEGIYNCHTLPRVHLPIHFLFSEEICTTRQAIQLVQNMLAS